jgi:hypothetical protein
MSATPTKTSPADRRYAGIKAINDRVVTNERRLERDDSTGEEVTRAENVWHLGVESRAIVASWIREELRPLGRTARWQQAVADWASMVESQEDERGYTWAFFQYGIFACHAAE